MKRLVSLFSLLLSLVCTAQAQVIVEAHLDTANILIGEQVQLRVKCVTDAKQRVTFPSYAPQQELTPGIEVVNNGRIDTTYVNDRKRVELTRRYTITAWDSALYQIPPFEVQVDGKAYRARQALGLKVNTVAVDTVHVDKLRPAKGVVEMDFEWTWRQTLLLLFGTLLAIVCIWLLKRAIKTRVITRRIVVKPPTPPHIVALDAIEKIKQTPSADTKAYYMQLTEALRDYLEKRFDFNAREMTSQEIIDQLQLSANAEALAELREVLLTADLVKFAKHNTTLVEQDRSLLQALNYIKTTKVEPAEQPKPHVEYITLSDKRTRLLRIVMFVGGTFAAVVAAALLVYFVYDLYRCYF